MSFLHLYARSLWQTIKQRIRQWVKPDNHCPVLNAALDLARFIILNERRLHRIVKEYELDERIRRVAHRGNPSIMTLGAS